MSPSQPPSTSSFLQWSWLSPQLTLAYYGNVLKACRTCLAVWINHDVLEGFCALFLSVYLSLSWPSCISPLCSFSLCLSLTCSFHFIFLLLCLLSLSPISLLLSLPPDFRWVHRLPKRLTTHPHSSLIELRSIRTSPLRFNLFWPERRACTPSLYHYNRRTGRRHRGSRDESDPECNHPNAPQQRASNRIRGYGNGVEGWLRFQ